MISLENQQHQQLTPLNPAQEVQMQLASICLGLHRSVEPSLICLRLGTQDAIRKPGLPEKEWNSLHGMLEIIVNPYVDIYECIYIYIYLSLSLSLSQDETYQAFTFWNFWCKFISQMQVRLPHVCISRLFGQLEQPFGPVGC